MGNAKPKQGLCVSLGDHVYNYGHKGSADKLKTSWEKLVQYVGNTYGHDISNKLQNRITVVVAEPVQDSAIMIRHDVREIMVCSGQATMQAARRE